MWHDPVVEELHRQRRQHSDQFKQDLAAMVDVTQKIAELDARAARKARGACAEAPA